MNELKNKKHLNSCAIHEKEGTALLLPGFWPDSNLQSRTKIVQVHLCTGSENATYNTNSVKALKQHVSGRWQSSGETCQQILEQAGHNTNLPLDSESHRSS